MRNVFGDDDDDSPQNKGPTTFEIDEEYRRKLDYNRQRQDLERYEKALREGQIVEDDVLSGTESEDVSEPDENVVGWFMDKMVKLRKRDYGDDGVDEDNKKKKREEKSKKKKEEKKKKKKMYLKDVQAQQLLEGGPDFGEEDGGKRIQTYAEEREELKRALSDAVEAGEREVNDDDDDDEDLFRVKEGDDSEEEDEELKAKADEYFGEKSKLGEDEKFLRDFFVKKMWKEKDGSSKMDVLDEAELTDDDEAVWMAEEHEFNFRHEEKAAETVMSQSRIVEGSVRKKDSSRKAQRKSKEDRMKMAEIERQEELKRLKNVKKKEINEKMKKVLSVAGFKEGEECSLDPRDLDDEFDPEEYDKMMKAVFNDEYYGADDEDLCSDDDGEKPDFDKEDELLGLPKDWNVIKGGDGFDSTREKVVKQKENGAGDEEEEEEEEEEVEEEEEEREGKRKRKRKTSLVQRAKEALMEEYYKLDYEDTIGDLKTRFKFAKVQPNSYGLKAEEILFLDDTELNQYVPLKKMAPYVEKDWEVNSYKVKEQKRKVRELWEKIDENHDEKKRSKKRSKKSDVEEKKPAEKADEEGEAETSKLSKKAKRRRREAEKKLPPNRMVAYGKTN